MASQYDLTIVGGGIIGLATALKIGRAHSDLRLLLLEKESQLARHQTGNNSGVIHSGLYYRPGSLKARSCVAGRKELMAFCDENRIPYEICGKVVVATTQEELPRLDELHRRGLANGLEGLEIIREREDLAVSWQVRRAIQDWLKKKGVKVKVERQRADTRKRS